jgi:hypothetical protein
LYAKSARNRENSATQQSGRKQGEKKGGDAYDLGGAKQRTVIDEKEEKKTRREQRMEGEKSQSVDSVENHLDEEVGDPVFEGRAAGAPGLAN